MAVSKRVRFEVFKRDGFRCLYCGRTPPQVVLEADHILPVAGGGPDAMDNLATSCFDCNRGKSDVPLESASPPLAEVMDEAIEKREQMEAYNRFLIDQKAAEDSRVEEVGRNWYDRLKKPRQRKRYVFGPDRGRSVRDFLRRLPHAEVMDAVDIAHSRVAANMDDDTKCWKYFCGVCWKKIKDAAGE